jgi:hypothetical protein
LIELSMHRPKEQTTMMPMTPEMAKQHMQELLREAEAARLSQQVRSRPPHPASILLAPFRAVLAAIAREGQQQRGEQVTSVEKAESAADLPVAKPSAS